MNKKLIITSVTAVLLALPLAGLAFQPDPIPNNILITPNAIISGLFNFIWPGTVAFIVIMFIVAGFQFLTAHGEPGKLDLARKSVLWGVVGVVVILLAFSIITITRFAIGGGNL